MGKDTAVYLGIKIRDWLNKVKQSIRKSTFVARGLPTFAPHFKSKASAC